MSRVVQGVVQGVVEGVNGGPPQGPSASAHPEAGPRPGLIASPRGRCWAALRVYLLPIVCLLCWAMPHLDQGDWRTDTGRYAAIGLQAWRGLASGHGAELFWTLRLHPAEPWFNKPPLAIWLNGLWLWAIGPSVWAARLGSVLAACLTVIGVVRLTRAGHTRGVAMAAGLAAALTYGLFRRVREVSLDLWMAAFLTLGLAVLAAAVVRGPGANAGPTEGRARRWRAAVVGGGLVGLALLCKPLVGLGAVVVFAAWLMIEGRWRLLWMPAVAAAAALVVAGPWHASMALTHGEAFIGQYFGAEVAERAAGEIRVRPWWYYARMLAEGYWPWMVPMALGVALVIRRWGDRRLGVLRLALLSSLVWLVALSLFPDKAPRYALAFYPTLAVLAGWWLATHPPAGRRRWVRRATVLGVAGLALAAVVFAALPVRVQRASEGWGGAVALVRARQQENPAAPVYSVQIETNQAGRFYLGGAGWPTPIGSPEQAPVGATIIRQLEREQSVSAVEREIYRVGSAVVTVRVDGGGAGGG